MSGEEFAVTFPLWRDVVDHYLLPATGRSLGDLPIPDYVIWEWYWLGWTAKAVAESLADRAAKVRRVTAVRFFTDNPRRLMQ